jgi:DNA-binding GntR family transcriptional regulator
VTAAHSSSSASPPPGPGAHGANGAASPGESHGSRGRTGRIYDDLRETIVRGRLAPGSRIIETELAQRLGVSRTPVRAALQRLTQEGYVTAVGPGRQMRLCVAPLTEDDARELFELVGELEGMAARRLARKAPQVREEVAAELEALDRELLDAARQEPAAPDRIFVLFTRFHRRMVEAGAGPRLRALHASVKPQADRYRRLYSSTQVPRIHASLEEHGEILEAVREGDADGAHQAVRANWKNAVVRLGEAIRRSGEIGTW